MGEWESGEGHNLPFPTPDTNAAIRKADAG